MENKTLTRKQLKQREWEQAHREQRREQRKAWRIAHPQREAEAQLRHAMKVLEALKAKQDPDDLTGTEAQ